ncbi:aldehyde dehydrogenase (NADP(+)) [Parasphingorhabdus sp.]|uniref:aldehyde dehydrogenase (NADP(+)) n=1 Tax=Parasphingorhabdus sp. TaxID=2709688 RepID=UPI002B277AC8|nr:aldehyde dehydrogenase (NADP(+)) [Parasphingorhabdus sp.]
MNDISEMNIPGSGAMLIGGQWRRGSKGPIYSSDAITGEQITPAFNAGGMEEIESACRLAEAAFDQFRETSNERRATFLEAIATEIEALGDVLILRVMRETGLPRPRVEGERGRTMGQLRLFAEVVREGSWRGLRHDPALAEREPAPRPDLRLRNIAIGPVAVFGASNFPLAFSVAGGDTASALAAGCPVVVKAHPAHLGTSVMIAAAIESARQRCDMPEGVFSLLIGADNDFGTRLVSHPYIKAVGFTGSRSGGTALMKIAAKRREPIPVYAEMSSINPVVLLPHALQKRADAIASSFAQSLNLGAGQFCTNPGILFAIEGQPLDRFISSVSQAIADLPALNMLTPAIHETYAKASEHRSQAARTVARGANAAATFEAQACLFETTAAEFLDNADLDDEIFGPASLLVRCADENQLRSALSGLEGQLTIAMHIDTDDYPFATSLLPICERKAGRILVNGFGTGVEVAHSMVHGGPYPATSDCRTTSVGSLAISRFLRPVCYQDMPEQLLPDPWNERMTEIE